MNAKRKKIMLETIWKKMFNAVGLDWEIDEIERFAEKENWFLEYSWTTEEETEFREWLVIELRKRQRITVKAANYECSWFLLMYGWKTEDNAKNKS